MKRTFLATAGTIAVLSLAAAGNAFAAGNDASSSIGAVQVGPTATAPAIGTTTPADGSLAATAPVGVTGTGGNTASNGIGAVQAGGSNSATNSTGALQATGVQTSPDVSAGQGSTAVQAGTTAASGGKNDANGSIGTAQIGGTNSATKVATTSAAGNQGATVPVTLGGNGSNSAGNSVGAVQVGGGNGNAETPPATSTPPPSGATPPAGTGTTTPPAGGTTAPAPVVPSTGGGEPANSPAVIAPLVTPEVPVLPVAAGTGAKSASENGAGGVAGTSAARTQRGATAPKSQQPKHAGSNPCLTTSSMGFDAPAGPGTPLPVLGAGLLFLFGLVRMSLVGRKPLSGLLR